MDRYASRMKQSHLEMRTLATAADCSGEATFMPQMQELDTLYDQLGKWYEEGHYLLDDYVRVHANIDRVKETIAPHTSKPGA